MTKAQEIIEIFEDYLEKKGITIDNPEKEGRTDTAIIYGTEYGDMENEINNILSSTCTDKGIEKYAVNIKEIYSTTIICDAYSYEEAQEKVKNAYNHGLFVLDGDNSDTSVQYKDDTANYIDIFGYDKSNWPDPYIL